MPNQHKFGQVERPSWFENVIREVLFGDKNVPADEFLMDRKQGLSKGRFDFIVVSSLAKSSVIFVHGFRSTFDDSLYRFAQVIYDGQLRDNDSNNVLVAFTRGYKGLRIRWRQR